DQRIRLRTLVPVGKTANRVELNAQIDDFPPYLAHEHRLGLSRDFEAYVRHPERVAGYLQHGFETRDSQDLARRRRLLEPLAPRLDPHHAPSHQPAPVHPLAALAALRPSHGPLSLPFRLPQFAELRPLPLRRPL
ncbi:hypothetical protein ACV354_31610, partial [Pseudomonas aeruginosa]